MSDEEVATEENGATDGDGSDWEEVAPDSSQPVGGHLLGSVDESFVRAEMQRLYGGPPRQLRPRRKLGEYELFLHRMDGPQADTPEFTVPAHSIVMFEFEAYWAITPHLPYPDGEHDPVDFELELRRNGKLGMAGPRVMKANQKDVALFPRAPSRYRDSFNATARAFMLFGKSTTDRQFQVYLTIYAV